MNEKMPKSDYFLVGSVILFLVIVFGGLYFFFGKQKNELEENLTSTYGTITRSYKVANGAWHVKVRYRVDGTCYEHGFRSTWCCHNRCKGDSLKIEYSSKDPNIARAISPSGKVLYPGTKVGKQDYAVDCDE